MVRILKEAKQEVPEFLGSGGGGGGGGGSGGGFGGTDFRSSNKSAPPPAHGEFKHIQSMKLLPILIFFSGPNSHQSNQTLFHSNIRSSFYRLFEKQVAEKMTRNGEMVFTRSDGLLF